MKMTTYETKEICVGTQAYKSGKHAVTVYDDGGELLGVQINANSYNKSVSNQSVRHFSEMIHRCTFDAMKQNLVFLNEKEVEISIQYAME